MSEDTILLKAFVEHADQQAFRNLVERHLNLVYNAAYRLVGNASAAEDVSQEVFTRLARKAKGLQDHPCVVAWLHSATRFVVKECLRAEARRSRREEIAALHEDRTSDSNMNGVDIRPVIDDALGQLSEIDRAAILLRFFEDKSFEEIGGALHVGENAARMRVQRALLKLENVLKRVGISSSSAAIALALAQQNAYAAAPALLSAVCSSAVAVGGGSASATAAAVTISLMKYKVVFIALAGAAVIGVSTTVHQANRARRLEERLASAQTQLAGLESKMHEAEQRASAANDHSREPHNPKSASIQPQSPGAPRPRTEAVERLVVSDPRLASLYVQQEALRYRSEYGPFYASAGFSPEDEQSFEKVLLEYSQAASDIRVAALARGFSADDAAALSLLKSAAQEREARLQSLLGPQKYEEYQSFNATGNGRALADRLAVETYYTSQPLTLSPADLLARLATEYSAQKTKTGIADWDSIINEAAKHLPPEHVARLRAYQRQATNGIEIGKITQPSVKDLPPE